MAFPTSPVTGQSHTSGSGSVYVYTSNGAWALSQETTFSVANFLQSNAVDSSSDRILWYDSSASEHRYLTLDQLATLLGSTVTPGGSGVTLI